MKAEHRSVSQNHSRRSNPKSSTPQQASDAALKMTTETNHKSNSSTRAAGNVEVDLDGPASGRRAARRSARKRLAGLLTLVVLMLFVGVGASRSFNGQDKSESKSETSAVAEDSPQDGAGQEAQGGDEASDEDAAAGNAGAEDAEGEDDEPEQESSIGRLVRDIDAKAGTYVVSPLESVIFYDLGILVDLLMGEPQPVPAADYWPAESTEQLQEIVREGWREYQLEYQQLVPSDQEFREKVFDLNRGTNEAGEPNPLPPTTDADGNLISFPQTAGYTYVYNAEAHRMEIVGRPQIPFIVVWLLIGAVFFTFKMRFINFRAFWHAIRLTKGDFDDPDEPGEVSHFQALASALSATVGLGNIAGVAIAIGTGGPGATFWMILIGLFGMTMKFNECTLGQLYRVIGKDGVVFGGPMRYLRVGLKEMKLAPLGIVLSLLFSVLCIGASFGGGNAFQVRQSLDAISQEDMLSFLEDEKWSWIYGVVMAGFVGLVIIGGIRAIGNVASKIVPFMCGAYVLAALYIIVTNASAVPTAFQTIFSQAFSPQAMYGGFLGCMMLGIKRAVFSNEAGAGSAAIAHSAAKTDEPVSEGIVALLEPFIDTVVVCTMTALVVVITGVYAAPEQAEIVAGNQGAALTLVAFQSGGHEWFKWILYLAVILFAYSTMISWSYYGERCWVGLFGAASSIVYKVLFLVFVVLGSVVQATNVMNFSDMLILGMAFPNLMGGVLLSGKVKRALDEYWGRYRRGEIKTYK